MVALRKGHKTGIQISSLFADRLGKTTEFKITGES